MTAARAAVDLEVVDVTKSFDGATTVLDEVSLSVPAGEIVALLGASGCGKTTLLRTIAGLEVPDAGRVVVGGRVLTDGRKVVPPERRHVGMVFQDWALFPHLSVAANVGYGLPRGERKGPRVDEALALVGLDGMGRRSPGTLSGGQQQRVALARALAPRPSLLLFDEPFSNLDTALRVAIRTEVHALVTSLDITCVFVTHDQQEAFVLGDEVAVMDGGRIVQQAPPAELYAAPATPWVARFVGEVNLLPGAAADGVAVTAVGPIPLRDPSRSGPVEVLVRPETLGVEPAAPGPSPDAGSVDAVVDRVEAYGHDSVLLLGTGGGPTLRARVPGTTTMRVGDRVTVRVGATPRHAFPAATGIQDRTLVELTTTKAVDH